MKNWNARLKCIWANKGKHGFQRKMRLCLLPVMAGLVLFYLLPFLKVILFSFRKGQFQKKFVGFANYAEVLGNPYFRLALKNTLLMIGICVPVFLLLSLLLTIFSVNTGKLGRYFRKLVFLPLFMPSVSITAAFTLFLPDRGTPVPVYVMFLWKYLGMGIVILTAAYLSVPYEIYEAAQMDGAGKMVTHLKITLPLMKKAIQFVGVMGVVYCFRTFRESYLYYGQNYPPDYSYTLQYYMNNQFLKLNYQFMAAASVIIVLLIAVFVTVGSGVFHREEKHA